MSPRRTTELLAGNQTANMAIDEYRRSSSLLGAPEQICLRMEAVLPRNRPVSERNIWNRGAGLGRGPARPGEDPSGCETHIARKDNSCFRYRRLFSRCP